MLGGRKRYTKAELSLRMGAFLFVALACLGILALSGMAAWNMFQRYRGAARADATAEQEYAQALAQYSQAKMDTDKLSSDRGLEEALRQRFGVVRPDEGVIQLVGGAEPASTSPAASENFFTHLLHSVF